MVNPILQLLVEITAILDRLHIPYMVSGSVAMTFYAISRSTRDIDVVVYLQETDIELLIENLPNFYYHKESMQTEVRRGGLFNMIDNKTGFKIDFIILKQTEYGLQAFASKQQVDILGQKIWVIAIEDLILAKLQWIQALYSDRQVEDIKQLLPNPAVDLKYVDFWVKKLQLNSYDIFE